MSDDKKLIEVQHLQQYFPAGGRGKKKKYVQAVDDVSFYIKKGETLGLVGESGCGKTTVGRTLLRLYEPTDGTIIYDGDVIFDKKKKIAVNMLPYRRKMQMVFQDPYASLDPRMSIQRILEEPLRIHERMSAEEKKSRILPLLEQVGLSRDSLKKYPHEFSGGQRQRIAIARALVTDPQLLLCDEPVSALDVSIQAQILNLLKDLQEKKKLTYVFVSHDMSVISHISDRVLVMYLGQAVELAEKEDLFEHPLHPYTQALMQAVPIPDPREQDQCKVLEGEIPSPMDLPSGCPFCARCKKALAICKEIRPQMAETADGHQVACHLYTDGGKQ